MHIHSVFDATNKTMQTTISGLLRLISTHVYVCDIVFILDANWG